MTGESDTILKSHKNPFLTSGSNIAEGSGRMLAMRVGSNSGMFVLKFLLYAVPNPFAYQSGVKLWKS